VLPLVAGARREGRVDGVGEVRIGAVKLVGIDAHDGAVEGVHGADARGVMPAEEEVVVGFVEVANGGDGRAGEMGETVEGTGCCRGRVRGGRGGRGRRGEKYACFGDVHGGWGGEDDA